MTETVVESQPDRIGVALRGDQATRDRLAAAEHPGAPWYVHLLAASAQAALCGTKGRVCPKGHQIGA